MMDRRDEKCGSWVSFIAGSISHWATVTAIHEPRFWQELLETRASQEQPPQGRWLSWA